MLGEEYVSRGTGIIRPAKTPRFMEHCGCRFKCDKHFDAEAQATLTKEYCAVLEKKSFVSPLIIEKEIQRPRSRSEVPKKSKTKYRFYYLPNETGKVRVCQKFFCFIFQISYK